MAKNEGSSSGTGTGTGTPNDDRCKVYAKVDAKLPEKHKGCTPVMVSIRGPSGMAEQRNAIDVVLVLHVHIRYVVPTNWHSLLNEATKLLVEKLGENDRLAVVPALLKEAKIVLEDAVIVPVKPKLLPMFRENKDATCNAVESSEAMRSYSPLVRDLELAESILYGRGSDDKEQRAGYIFVVSNSNEDLSSVLPWRLHSVHAFGFGDAHNARTMYTITRSGDSTYAILDDEGGQIAEAFGACIDKITSAIEPLEVKVKCKEEVLLSEIYAPRICYFISYDKKVGIIWAHAHRACAATNFIFFLEIPEDYYEYSNLLEVQAKFGQASNSKETKVTRLVQVSEGMSESMEVAAEMVRMEALFVVTEIIEAQAPFDTALRRMRSFRRNANAPHRAAPAKRTGFQNDSHAAAVELRKWRDQLEEYNYRREAAKSAQIQQLRQEMRRMEPLLVVKDQNDSDEFDQSKNDSDQPEPDDFGYRRKAAKSAQFDKETQKMEAQRHRPRNDLWLERMLSWRSLQWWPLPPVIANKKDATGGGHTIKTGTAGRPLLRLRILAKVDAIPAPTPKPQRGLPVLVQVVVLSPPELEKQRVVPVDLVAVLDVRRGGDNAINDKKLRLLRKAMEFVMEKLNVVQSRLAIVPAFTESEPAFFGITEARSKCTKLLSVLTSVRKAAQETSHWKEQLKKGLCLPTCTFNIPWTDLHGSNKLHKSLEDAIKLLDGRSESDKRRLGLIILISDSDGISVPHRTLSSNNYTIHAFSLCGVDNARALYRIASSSSGIYGVLHDDHRDELTKVFEACITKITSTVAGNTEVKIACSSSSAKLSAIESGHFRSSVETGSIHAGALYPGAERKFVVYVENVRQDEYGNMFKILTVNVASPDADFSDKSVDEIIVRGRDPGSKELVEEIVRIEKIKILSAIADPKTKTDAVLDKVQELRRRLRLQHGRRGRPGPDSELAVEEESLARLASDKDGSCLSHMLSRLSLQGLCEQPPEPSSPQGRA